MAVMVAAALIIAGVALFVAAPLASGLGRRRSKSAREAGLERLAHERGLAVQGLRELEFDREMGKLSDADYGALRTALENRALKAMQETDQLRDQLRKSSLSIAPTPAAEAVKRPVDQQPPVLVLRPETRPPDVLFCPQCGTRTLKDARFCAECGTALKSTPRATNWNE
jgi:cytochrome c-type biogenesis protein CcmI